MQIELSSNNILVPLDVPESKRETYINNYKTATHGSGRLMLFAGDQKVEHLNDDFFGEGIHIDNNNPEHLFKIACKAKIGVFATQLGLIARYGMDYPDIPYLIKLNSKSHLVKTNQRDPVSNIWYFKDYLRTFVEESKLNILAVGYTIYLGSEFESEMLSEAAQTIFTAHQMGLFTVLWIYPRGKAIPDEKNPHLIAGATGIGAALGSDFVKVNAPSGQGLLGNAINSLNPAEHLKEAVQSAGRTKVICAGGTNMDAATFLNTLYDQIYIAGVSGNATGRNIHQKPLAEAIRFANAIYAITIENKTVEEALQIYNG